MRPIVETVVRRVRPLAAATDGRVPARVLARRYLSKGAGPAARGLVVSVRMPHVSLPFFVGRSCHFLSASHLHTQPSVFIGDFSYVDAFSVEGVHLGARVTIREFAWIQLTSSASRPGAGIEIGDDTYIGPRSVLGAGGWLRIGARCQIGAAVSFVAESHEFRGHESIYAANAVRREGIRVGDDCWIGNGVTVLDGVSIGDGAVIGAGSVVTRDVPPRAVAYGVPARVRASVDS
jgi:acetyltransferase-like isoleucine patch superfamily enzyme